MQPSAPNSETRFLIVSAIGNLVVGCVGLVVSVLSASQAILLDGLFNLTYFAAGLFTIKVASLLSLGDDERFPYHYASFEPLVNGIKGLLVLGVSIIALIGAAQALLTGGRAIDPASPSRTASLPRWCVGWPPTSPTAVPEQRAVRWSAPMPRIGWLTQPSRRVCCWLLPA